jgi:hypothetical protein
MHSKSNQTATNNVINSHPSEVLDLNNNFKIFSEVKRMYAGDIVGDGALKHDSNERQASV